MIENLGKVEKSIDTKKAESKKVEDEMLEAKNKLLNRSRDDHQRQIDEIDRVEEMYKQQIRDLKDQK